MSAQELVEVLRAARQDRGVFQRDLSALLDVGTSAVGTWETHAYYPRVDIVRRWCGVLDVDVPEGVDDWFRPPSVRCGTRHSYEVHRSKGEHCLECCRSNTEYMRRWRTHRIREARLPLPLPRDLPVDGPDRPRARRAFVAKMRAKRVGVGVKQADVGEPLGVHANTVGKWERGEMCPTAEMAEAWAGVLGVHVVGGSLDEIFRRERALCGTPRGYRQHHRRGERCPDCSAAYSIYIGGLKKLRQGRQAA